MLQMPDTKFAFYSWNTTLWLSSLFIAGFIMRSLFLPRVTAGVILSPRSTLLPKLSKQDRSSLPYPPDVFPGARDVDSPFGTFRVFEWGPENGRKVLLVHGISTPCLSLGGVAHALADKGCRVMLFDLPGRGYSDTPADIRQDMCLFTSQILLVLATSPLSWSAATGGFDLVGYSLGGGISAAFASYFPDMIRSLTLIAPAGLIRDYHISRVSRMLYSEGIIPEKLLHRIVKKRLQKPLYPPKPIQPSGHEKTGASEVVEAETNTVGKIQSVLSKSYPDLILDAAVNHQILNHDGFVHAFMSSIRYGPIRHQHDKWRRIGRRLTEKNKSSQAKEKVLVVLGERDPIIIVDEVKEDASDVLEDNVEFKVLPAGHDVPVSKAGDVANFIWENWPNSS